MKLSTVLEAQRQATPGLRLYALTQQRQSQVLNRIWINAHAPETQAKAQFLAELERVVRADGLKIRRASESSGYFTIEFPGTRPFHINELVVHIGFDALLPRPGKRGGHKLEAGCWVQVRRAGDPDCVHRRMTISAENTPAQVWARVRPYFVAETVEIELAAAA